MRAISDKPGLYALDDAMPCTPSQIVRQIPWAFPGLLNKQEPEEAAARLLHFSIEMGEWVGMSWTRLIEMMQADVAAYKADPQQAVMTTVYFMGARGVITGFQELLKRELVRLERLGTESEPNDVFVPLPALVDCVLAKYGRRAA